MRLTIDQVIQAAADVLVAIVLIACGLGLCAGVLMMLTMLSGCQRPAESPECSGSTLATIEAAYVAEALTACRGETFTSCRALPALEAKYTLQREEWSRCR